MSSQAVSSNRIAVLDLGTNTFHLLIVEVAPDDSYKKIFKSKIAVKLGEGGIHLNYIAPKAFARGIKAIQHYFGIIEKYKVKNVYSFATAAIRSATNGIDFTHAVFEKTGLKVNVIRGEEEARLICLGVRQAIKLNKEAVLIMDIGGGSTEFIIANRVQIYARHSFYIGVAKLLELIKPSDPISNEDINKIEKFLEDQLKELDASMSKYNIKTLIGCSGSFDTFAEMIGYRFHGRNVLKKVKAYTFELSEYCELHDILINSTIQQRRKMKGLIKMRIDMIVLASICTKFVLQRYNLNEMALSKFALKEGALWEIIKDANRNKYQEGHLSNIRML